MKAIVMMPNTSQNPTMKTMMLRESGKALVRGVNINAITEAVRLKPGNRFPLKLFAANMTLITTRKSNSNVVKTIELKEFGLTMGVA